MHVPGQVEETIPLQWLSAHERDSYTALKQAAAQRQRDGTAGRGELLSNVMLLRQACTIPPPRT